MQIVSECIWKCALSAEWHRFAFSSSMEQTIVLFFLVYDSIQFVYIQIQRIKSDEEYVQNAWLTMLYEYEEFNLCDMTPYTPAKVQRYFGRIYCPHLQGRSPSQVINKRQETSWDLLTYSLTLKKEAFRSFEILLKFYRTIRGHDVVIVAAVRISNLTYT